MNRKGPLSMLMGMSWIVGFIVKMNYLFNRVGLEPSYNVMHNMGKRLIVENTRIGRPSLNCVKPHGVAVFAVENIDTTNHQGIVD